MTGIIPIPKDNASAQLSAGVNASSLAFVLKSSEGANLPQPIDGVATSSGDNTTLPSTGIQSAGVAVGDFIYNLTDSDPSSDEWAGAVVLSVSTNSVTTAPLTGGSDNLWEASDEWVVDPFVINLSKRTGGVLTGAVTQFEKVLITSRSTDTLSIPAATGYRGFDSTTPNTFAADDFVTIETDQSIPDGMRISLARVYQQLHEDFLRLDGTKAMTAALDMGTQKINNVVDPVADQDAATKIWVLANTLSAEPEDTVFRIIDDGDNTKKIAFSAGGITTGTTRTATMPDKDFTLAGTDDVGAVLNFQFVRDEANLDGNIPGGVVGNTSPTSDPSGSQLVSVNFTPTTSSAGWIADEIRVQINATDSSDEAAANDVVLKQGGTPLAYISDTALATSSIDVTKTLRDGVGGTGNVIEVELKEGVEYTLEFTHTWSSIEVSENTSATITLKGDKYIPLTDFS